MMTKPAKHYSPCITCGTRAGQFRRRNQCRGCYSTSSPVKASDANDMATEKARAMQPLPPYGTSDHEDMLALRARLKVPMRLASDRPSVNLN